MTKSLEERFWSKVDKDGPTMSHMDSNCWTWTASQNGHGYGQFRVGEAMLGAHRVSLSFALGRLSEMQTMHACDNRACVRPDHLSEGTQSQNLKDAYRRGGKKASFRSGEEHSSSKLNKTDVLEIRRRHREGETQKALGKLFGVSQLHISRIVRRKAWAHVN